ncbi:hypothetical protein [Ornithinicoccus hortensis]|uniref:Uncharacterized protein n=1 Tax=Ornithinicoccus hortensis TaxID=82346 RepID=A0A542YU08_9MICO|nr:hypothetical protein [Ornithinicoccus hortensis]TQL51566.1 hypothetical protein FB467_2716 [Ornithinicoccus hortensis]
MRRQPHENVATVLVAPPALVDLELELMAVDLRLWPVESAPICEDGPRTAFQIRHRLLEKHRGEWDCASGWLPVWISFGDSWRDGEEPLPWAAHAALWHVLDSRAEQVRFHRRLEGVPKMPRPEESSTTSGRSARRTR